jgi:hypothetical protein
LRRALPGQVIAAAVRRLTGTAAAGSVKLGPSLRSRIEPGDASGVGAFLFRQSVRSRRLRAMTRSPAAASP